MGSRAFILLFLAMLLSTMGIGMVSPILPVIAKDLGATGAWIGLAFSAFAITQGSTTILVGRLSDRWGRRRFIAAGFLFFGVSAVGYALASSFYEIVFWRAFAGFGTAAVFPVAMAYVGDLSPPGREGTFAGTFNVATWVGYGLGPLLGGLIRDTAGDDGAFWTMAAMLFATSVLVFLLLPRSPRFTVAGRAASVAAHTNAAKPSDVPLRTILRDNMVRAVVIFHTIEFLAFGVAFGFLAVFMTDELGASAVVIGAVLAVRTVANGVLAPIFGRMADSYSRIWLVTLGMSGSAVAVFFIGDSETVWLLLALFLAAGILEGLAWPAATALSLDLGRRYGMGGMMGLTQTAGAVGILGGTVAAGVLSDALEISAVFRFAAVTTLAGAAAFLFFAQRNSPIPASSDREGALPLGSEIDRLR